MEDLSTFLHRAAVCPITELLWGAACLWGFMSSPFSKNYLVNSWPWPEQQLSEGSALISRFHCGDRKRNDVLMFWSVIRGLSTFTVTAYSFKLEVSKKKLVWEEDRSYLWKRAPNTLNRDSRLMFMLCGYEHLWVLSTRDSLYYIPNTEENSLRWREQWQHFNSVCGSWL